MRKAFVAVLLLALGATTASAGDDIEQSVPGTVRAVPGGASAGKSSFGTAGRGVISAAADTVWIGHNSAFAGGAFLGVGVNGVWDFDTDVAGTDSTQGWRRFPLRFAFGGFRPAEDRPEWALNYGNIINVGNTNLWAAHDLAGRKYVKTGVAGAWHSDTMAGVKLNVANNAEPSASPIHLTRSAWCGLRESGNLSAQDALTGNYLNGDVYMDLGGTTSLPEFPGYMNLWDQMMYKDFSSTGTGTVSCRVAVELSTFVDPVTPNVLDRTAWFNPDPTSLANLVINPADSFMVYVGSPNENAYDTNRRWFSEVLDLTKPYQQLYRTSGPRVPVALPDTQLTLAYSGITPISSNVRVVFRVKTNRARSDGSVGTLTGSGNTKIGAAMLDQVQVDGGLIEGFESAGQITARSLIPNIATAGGPWATTGKPPGVYMHVQNVASLIYDDLCGQFGEPTRTCNLLGNVMVAGNFDNGNLIEIEHYQSIASPTVDLAVRSAAPNAVNTQGIDQETAARVNAVMGFEIYSGNMDLDEATFYRFAAQSHGPAFKQPVSGTRMWGNFNTNTSISFEPDPRCYEVQNSLSEIGVPVGSIDSLRIHIASISLAYNWPSPTNGITNGTYFDNARVGLIRGAAASLSQDMWDKFQDQFPWNEIVSPGDNPGFDTTAARMNGGLNNVAPASQRGVVAADSIIASSPYVGDGITSGARLDLIFRIDPGPGNYTVAGNRASALVARDPARNFFAKYLANNGPYGTPGGHGGTWNRHVWNSARMDSAQANVYPVLSQGTAGTPISPEFMGTLHEADPNFATLGIERNICFRIDPVGSISETNLDCSGTPPAIYGAVTAATKEGTKILPDGWFTPGTHIEYFIRQSMIESPGTYTLLFDTTLVSGQDPAGQIDLDLDRWSSVDVLPDMWKSDRFGGAGLACMLMVDGADRRGSEPAFIGAADSLGFGKNNGAKKGWKGLGAGSDPDDPAGFVAANNGQAGLNYDLYEIKGSEASEAGHPGVRFATNLAGYALKGDTSGPSAAMLANLYDLVLHSSGDLSAGTLHDSFDPDEAAKDIDLYEGFLTGATGGDRRGLWLSGDGIMEDSWLNSDNGAFLYPFLSEVLGADYGSRNYKDYAQTARRTVGFLPAASWNNAGSPIYGFNHSCFLLADVLTIVPNLGAAPAATYEAIGPGPAGFVSSVYRPIDPGVREFRTLFDGFDFRHLRGNYSSLAAIETQLGTDNGRIAWFDDVVAAHFQICARIGTVVAVGDQQGVDAARFSNMNLGAFPNPAFAAKNVTLRFTLAKAQNVTVRIYNVAGREVANFSKNVTEAGPVNMVWDGNLSNGAKATPGVYFYRVDGVDFGGSSAPNKMILLSSAQ